VLGLAQRWEIDIRGCFRYGPAAYPTAVSLVDRGWIDLSRMITAHFPFEQADDAVRAAIHERHHLKIAVLAKPDGAA
jgi:L-iditol 2-dehydrogenase